MSACMSCDESEVEALLSKGASVDTAALDGLTALHQVRMVSHWAGHLKMRCKSAIVHPVRVLYRHCQMFPARILC